MPLEPVSVAARIQLEAALGARWNKWHVNGVLRSLEHWSGWVWPLESAVQDAIPHVSKPVRAKYLGEAKAELNSMLQLPPVTPAEERMLIEHKIAFALLPPSALVRQEDRVLNPWHALVVIGRGLPMLQAVSAIIGGMVLVPFTVLEAEKQRQDDIEAVELLRLQHAARPRPSRETSGPSAAWITF